jgi:hypothetical protein
MPAPKPPVFHRYDPHRVLLLPPNLEERLPPEHLARFISDLVDNEIDLTPFVEGYENEERATPPTTRP